MNKWVETNCCYCGEALIGENFHRQCVIDDIYETLYGGNRLKPIHYSRAKNKKINISEIRKEVEQDREGKLHV